MLSKSDRKTDLVLVLSLAGLGLLFLFSGNFSVRGDNAASLFVSQSLIERHSFRLDMDAKYGGYAIRKDFYNVIDFKEHRYEYAPPGTAIFSLPAVYIAKMLGMNMIVPKHQRIVSQELAILLNVLIFLILFLIGKCFVSDGAAFAITSVSFLGSSLTSTLGVGFGSHHYAVLFSVIVVFLLALNETGRIKSPMPVVIGILLFSSFLCRPATACFVIVVLVYLYVKDIRIFLKTAGAAFFLFLCFVGFSLSEYGQALPPYYHDFLFNVYIAGAKGATAPGRDENIIEALYGILFSPSRGLFVFSPFLLVVFFAAIGFWGRLKNNRLYWICLGWWALYVTMIANLFGWEGGYCFGPRLFVDSIPAFVLLSFLLWSRMGEIKSAIPIRRFAIAAYFTLGAVAIWINSYQGVFNKWAVDWNDFPPLEEDVRRFTFDWKYPQFLADGELLKNKVLDYYGKDRVFVIVDNERNEITYLLRLPGKEPSGK